MFLCFCIFMFQVPEIKEIILVGFFKNEDIEGFVETMNEKYCNFFAVK